MINRTGTRMAKDGKDWHGLQNNEFEKNEDKILKCANRGCAPLRQNGTSSSNCTIYHLYVEEYTLEFQ